MGKRILLWDLDTAFLVIECASGVTYQNQVGGVYGIQAELEGVLAPVYAGQQIFDVVEALDFQLCAQGITEEAADAIDHALSEIPETAFLSVDRERLADSWEAWVHVRIGMMLDESDRNDTVQRGLYGFGGRRGVLTWPNSD